MVVATTVSRLTLEWKVDYDWLSHVQIYCKLDTVMSILLYQTNGFKMSDFVAISDLLSVTECLTEMDRIEEEDKEERRLKLMTDKVKSWKSQDTKPEP